MAKQVYYEDIETGFKIPSLVKHPTTEQLVRWAAAAGDYYPIHYDKDFAQSLGLPGVIVHGQLVACFLSQLITDWAGGKGTVTRLTVSYRRTMYPGEDIVCQGEVTKKYVKDGDHYVECNISAENLKGEKSVTGAATVILPARE